MSGNLKRQVCRPTSYRQFQWHYAYQPGFWEGWRDAVENRGYRPEYEGSYAKWQHQYENARECVVELRARKMKLPTWPEKKRAVAVWNVMDKIMEPPHATS